jgi:hypothetical protein
MDQQHSDQFSNKHTLAINILAIILLPIYLAVTFTLIDGYALLTSIIPILFLIYKKIHGVLLPYIVAIGVFRLSIVIKSHLDNASDYLNIQNYTPIFLDRNEVQLAVYLGLIALSLSVLSFILTTYGLKITKILANILFRSLAIFLIIFPMIIAAQVVDKAKVPAQEDYYREKTSERDNTTLSKNIPLYQVTLPEEYKLWSVSLANAKGEHHNYTLRYSAQNSPQPEISVKVSDQGLPSSCEPTTTPKVQTNDRYGMFSCNVVLITPDGQHVYGYRNFASVQSRGTDPLQLSQTEIKSIQPQTFYIQRDGAVIQIEDSDPADTQPNPLNQSTISTFVSTLKIVDNPTERQAFIDQYLKPTETTKPLPDSRQSNSPTYYLVPALVVMYIALFLWALEKIFQKANQQYWKVYIPFVNLWTLTTITGKPGWWSLLAYTPTNPYNPRVSGFLMERIYLAPILMPLFIVLTIIRFILFVVVSYSLALKFGKPKIFSLLLIIPPFPGYLILGFDASKYDHQDETIPFAPSQYDSPQDEPIRYS